MRSVYNNVLPVIALTSASRTANAAVNGTEVDLAVFNNNFRSVSFVVTTGTITDGAVVFKIQETDTTGTGYTDVPADHLLGTAPTTAATDDDKVFHFGFIPTKRFCRIVATQSTATSGGIYSAVALLSAGSNIPPQRS